MSKVRELEEDFIGKGEVKGFKFTQIKKNNYAYLYAVDTGDMVFFEVFKRVVNNRFNCVSYPRSKSFGKWAKTTRLLVDAHTYFDEYTFLGEEAQHE